MPMRLMLNEWDERVLTARRIRVRRVYSLCKSLDAYFNLSCWDGCEAQPKFVSTCSIIRIEYFCAYQGDALRE